VKTTYQQMKNQRHFPTVIALYNLVENEIFHPQPVMDYYQYQTNLQDQMIGFALEQKLKLKQQTRTLKIAFS
jgi:hypothetical protein